MLLLLLVVTFAQQEFFYTYEGKQVHLDIATDRLIEQPASPEQAEFSVPELADFVAGNDVTDHLYK
ncbi:MAG: hypothetical protein WD097_03070 [Balneolales bacterium]